MRAAGCRRWNRCWFAVRVIDVKRTYGLTVDRHELDALARTLAGCADTDIHMPPRGTVAVAATPPTGATVNAAGRTDTFVLYDDNRNGRITCAEARSRGIAPVPQSHPAYQVHAGRRRRWRRLRVRDARAPPAYEPWVLQRRIPSCYEQLTTDGLSSRKPRPLGRATRRRADPSGDGELTEPYRGAVDRRPTCGMSSHQRHNTAGLANTEVSQGLPVGTCFVGPPRVGITATQTPSEAIPAGAAQDWPARPQSARAITTSARTGNRRATLTDRENRSGCGIPMTRQSIGALVQLVGQQIDTEGLRPLAKRTGIPIGQLRSFVQGRASRLTTLQSIASAMGMQLFVARVEQRAMATPLPGKLARSFDLPPNTTVAEAVTAIERDAAGSRWRTAVRLMEEMTENATAVTELLSAIAASPIRMIPFAERVRFSATTGEVEFEESSDVRAAVAECVLPSWARATRLTCIRMAGGSTDAPLVVVDGNRRTPVDDQLFVVHLVDALTVKRLRQVCDQWNFVSDDSAHSPRPLSADDRIVGRVAWRGPHGVAVR